HTHTHTRTRTRTRTHTHTHTHSHILGTVCAVCSALYLDSESSLDPPSSWSAEPWPGALPPQPVHTSSNSGPYLAASPPVLSSPLLFSPLHPSPLHQPFPSLSSPLLSSLLVRSE